MSDPTPAIRRIQALPSAKGNGHQVTYEIGDSRRVHTFEAPSGQTEPAPHGAGSFHDPEHHHQLMERIEQMLKDAP